MRLQLTQQQLDQAPCFNKASWPDISNAEWRGQVENYYSNFEPPRHQATGTFQEVGERATQPSDMPTARDMRSGESDRTQMARDTGAGGSKAMWARRATEVMGTEVKNPEGQTLGRIRDLVVDTREGRVAYSILAVAGEAERFAVVPWSAIDLGTRTQMAQLNTDRRSLEASAFTERDLARLSDEQYARTIHDRFNREPYWEVYGYTPGGTAKSSAVWAADSEYNKQFNPNKVVTIKGTVVSVGTFLPQANSTPGLRLTVQSSDGRLYTVGAGPMAYAQKEKATFTTGENVEVTGSEISAGTIMASKVKGSEHTLTLRDSDGEPEWSMRDLEPAQSRDNR